MPRFLGNLSIKSKVTWAFSLIICGACLVGALLFLNLQTMENSSRAVRGNWFPSSVILDRIAILSLRYHLLQNTYLNLDAPQRAATEKAMAELATSLTAARRDYEPMASDAKQRAWIGTFDTAWAAYRTGETQYRALLQAGDTAKAWTFLRGPMVKDYVTAREALQADTDYNLANGQAAAQLSGAAYDNAVKGMVGGLIGMVVLALVIRLGFVRIVARPLVGMAAAMETLAGGEIDIAVTGTERRDELGSLARSLAVFRKAAEAERRLEGEKTAAMAAREARAGSIERRLAEFDGIVTQALDQLTRAATDLHDTAGEMTDVAAHTRDRSTAVSVSAQTASQSVQTVAAAAEELSASVSEIARQVTASADIADGAVREATHTHEMVAVLSAAAHRVGEVVTLINNIASQTNLLALNATIEAARAGDAGKGFAVVASEVKSLANQTAQATDEVRGQIEAMQRETAKAVEAINGVMTTIGSMNEITTAIAAAVEEQGAATREIARNTQEAAGGTGEVNALIGDVNEGAVKTGANAEHVLTAAGALGEQAGKLRAEVARFLSDIRAA